ncbi:MAG TPA: TlpA disulfide reductase family protein, partial [Solirubrobacterales bacterium]|nr:TlpA disulfide reductase family protein [Solirubrobacterales bacterium]
MRITRRRLLPISLAAAGLLAIGCGSDGGADSGAADAGTATTQSAEDANRSKDAGEQAAGKSDEVPAELAANRAQANEILAEGSLDEKLSELKGHPVVVNQWASWCPPCRAEFPYFQQAAEDNAADVAFLGIDMQDDRSAAEEFLAEYPVPYPSIDDPTAAAIGSLGGGVVSPTTVFI